MDTLIEDIDASTYRAARALAALEGRSLGDVVTAALREYMAKNASAVDVLPQPVESAADAPLLDGPGLDAPALPDDGGRPATHVDEVVFLYCI